jgi:hypothetical protein
MNKSTLVPREEMSDLDWLARNVHVWPEGKREVLVCRPRNVDTLIWSYVLSDAGWITKAQWLTLRAELQNKPSWEGAPDWAEWLHQDGCGEWEFSEGKPTPYDGLWLGEPCKRSLRAKVGEVLGDWRDTLEKRPVDLSEDAVTSRLKEATDNVLAAVPELMTEKYKFKPFVSVEDAKQDIGNLEWLAASIAEWPEIKDWNIKMDRGVSFFDDGVHIYNSDGSDYETISKRDWEIKVMELNKKPSIKTAKALAEAKLIEDKEPAGVYGVDHFYKPVCTEIAEDAATDIQQVITPSKYTKTIHGASVDVYDVLQAWGVSNPALQHLIKKALQCGQRGHKDNAQDLQDIIDSAIRAKELES